MGPRQSPGELSERLRALPSVQRLACELAGDSDVLEADPLLLDAVRSVIDERREQLRDGCGDDVDLLARAREALAAARRPSLRPVINATGVILHTNLGRAPLAEVAREAVARVAEGYSNLEIDLRDGSRGSRQSHVRELGCALTGAEDALVVNNGAGAVLLAVAALAGPGRSVVVSRGQLIEIGGSFRIPDVVSAWGSRLVEVGSTNRTRLADYERALAAEHAQGREVAAILRVHQSNFRTLGFVSEVAVTELCGLGVPVIDDLGSGVLDHAGLGRPARGEHPDDPDALAALAQEPSVRDSVVAGAALVCCSGDKLLGGPQAGLLVGTAEAIGAAARHPLARALRVDKLSLAALEATLALHRDPRRARLEIPVLGMLDSPRAQLAARAQRMLEALAGCDADVVSATARVGGGALPLLELEGPAVRVDPGAGGADALARALRRGDPPVVVRIAEGAILLDPRTMTDAQALDAARATIAALGTTAAGADALP